MTCFTLSCTRPFPIAQYYRLRHGQRPIESAKEGEAEVRAVLDLPVVLLQATLTKVSVHVRRFLRPSPPQP